MRKALAFACCLAALWPCWARANFQDDEEGPPRPRVIAVAAPAVVASTGTAFFLDTFSADSNLESHTPDLGLAWANESTNSSFSIASGEINDETTGGRDFQSNAVPSGSDYTCALEGKTGNTNSSDQFILRCRLSATDADYYQFLVDGTGAWRFTGAVATTETDLASGSIGGFDAATYYRIKMVMTGNRVISYINEVQVSDVTDSGVKGPTTGTGTIGGSARQLNMRITSLGGWQ